MKQNHRHLSNIDCLLVHTTCLVSFISAVNGRSKKKRKEAYKTGASSGHMTKLKQSILETLNIYEQNTEICKQLPFAWSLIEEENSVQLTYHILSSIMRIWE
jgi:hypothetical protein